MRFAGQSDSIPRDVLEHSRKVCAESGSSFLKCLNFVNQEQREGLTLFYAFCREVDDWADEENLGSSSSRKTILETIRSEIEGGEAAALSSHWETVQGAGYLMKSYGIPSKFFVDLVDGMLMDCDYKVFRLWDELLQYCYRVASSVGLVCVSLFHKKPETLYTYAIHQGVALQLVNIYRDFEADLQAGRCYLPVEWLHCEAEELERVLRLGDHERRMDPLFSTLLTVRERLRTEAKNQFELALAACPRRVRPSIWPLLFMGFSYMKLLEDTPVGSLKKESVKPLGTLKRFWSDFMFTRV